MYEEWLDFQLAEVQLYGLSFVLGSFSVATLSDLKRMSAQSEFVSVWAIITIGLFIIDVYLVGMDNIEWQMFSAKWVIILALSVISHERVGLYFKLATGDVVAIMSAAALMTPVAVVIYYVLVKIVDLATKRIWMSFGTESAYPFMPVISLATLAALDSTRLQTALSQHFRVAQDEVTGCRTYGGHGEQMAVFASTAKVQGKPLLDLIGTDALPNERWAEIRQRTCQGGKRIIELRGRSSFQSPSHQSLCIVRSAMTGETYPWPVGVYVNRGEFSQIMMAMETQVSRDGITYEIPKGTPEELQALRDSYGHLCKLRDEVVQMGVLPPRDQWSSVNPLL